MGKWRNYPARPLSKLSDTHKMYGRLVARGWSKTKAAEFCDFSWNVVKNLEATEQFHAFVDRERETFLNAQIDQMDNNPALRQAKKLCGKAGNRMAQILESDHVDPKEQVRAVDVVFRHAGGDVGKDNGNTAAVQINISNDKAADLETLEGRIVRDDEAGEESS